MDKETANKEMTKLVAEAYEALRKCEMFADEHKLSFIWSPFYGGGGHYSGDPAERTDGWGDPSPDNGWSSSSHGC